MPKNKISTSLSSPAMSSIRVCYVVNAVDETSVPADIATALARYTNIDTEILAWFNASGFEGDDQVPVTELNAPDTVIGADLPTIREACETLKGYDIVQAHHNHSGSFAKLIGWALGKPVVSREGNMRRGFTRLGLLANGLTNPLADRIICNSRAVYDSFMQWEKALIQDKQLELIPNGVEKERIEAGSTLNWSVYDETPVNRQSVVVGTAGLLTEQKDHNTLIRGIAVANSKTDQALELVIAGDGPLEPDLRHLVKKENIEDKVHFLGRLDRQQVYRMLYEIDIYAMPSLWEGFSAAAVEALATGTPAVFSDIPPFRQPYGSIARFHPVGDHDELGHQLALLADDPPRREQIGKRSKNLVLERYTMLEVAKKYSNIYRTIHQ